MGSSGATSPLSSAFVSTTPPGTRVALPPTPVGGQRSRRRRLQGRQELTPAAGAAAGGTPVACAAAAAGAPAVAVPRPVGTPVAGAPGRRVLVWPVPWSRLLGRSAPLPHPRPRRGRLRQLAPQTGTTAMLSWTAQADATTYNVYGASMMAISATATLGNAGVNPLLGGVLGRSTPERACRPVVDRWGLRACPPRRRPMVRWGCHRARHRAGLWGCRWAAPMAEADGEPTGRRRMVRWGCRPGPRRPSARRAGPWGYRRVCRPVGCAAGSIRC